MKRRPRPPKPRLKSPRKSGAVPVIKEMLDEARHELKHEIVSFRFEVGAGFKRVDAAVLDVRSDVEKVETGVLKVRAEVEDVKASVLEVRADIEEVRSDIKWVRSDMEKVLSAVHRVGLLVEEQNARNKFVLDGYAQLYDRLNHLEGK